MRLVSFVCLVLGVQSAYATFAFSNFSRSQQQFIRSFEPQITSVNQEILTDRQAVLEAQALLKAHTRLPSVYKEKMKELGRGYQVQSCALSPFFLSSCLNELRKRVDILPTDLILAQAINESNWGQSRFAKEGNNYFGIACVSKGCGMIPNNRPKGSTFEVRSFESARASIEGYYTIINTHQSYQALRDSRLKMRQENKPLDAHELAAGLESYSTEKKAYIVSIQKAIAHLQAFPVYKQ